MIKRVAADAALDASCDLRAAAAAPDQEFEPESAASLSISDKVDKSRLVRSFSA